MVSHSNIVKSFNKYIFENIEQVYGYPINYEGVRFESNSHDFWLSIVFEEAGAGAKKFSPVRIDVMSDISGVEYANDEIVAIDILRDKLTNVSIPVYDFPEDSITPVLIPYERIIVKNSDGRFTIERVILNNLREEDLKRNLRRSYVLLRVELLTDTIGGRSV